MQSTIAFLFLIGSFSAAFATVLTPEPSVEIPLQSLLVPPVFHDDNDEITLVLYGQIPPCHILTNLKIEKQSPTRLRIRQFARAVAASNCASKEPTSFTTEHFLGKMRAGDYDLRFLLPSGGLGFRYLRVTAAKFPMSIDDLNDAPIESFAAPEAIRADENLEIELTGYLSDSCTSLLGASVKIMQDVFIVEPTVYRRPNIFCAEVITPFKTKVSLGQSEAGIYLIQVRAMNGRGLNRVVRVLPAF